jgi:HEAT repeat protein
MKTALVLTAVLSITIQASEPAEPEAGAVLKVGTNGAAARPCGGVSADQALAEATLVVKGWLVSTWSGSVPGSDSSSVIRVDRVLKGVGAGQEVTVTYFLCGLEYRAAMRNDRPLIVFVNATGGLVNGTAVLPASRRTVQHVSLEAKADLRAELLLAATDDDPNTIRGAIGALAELDGTSSTTVLKHAARSDDFGVRVRALSWLTRFGDADAFEELANVLGASPFEPYAIPTMIRDDTDRSLAIALEDVMRSLSSFAERDFTASTMPLVDGSRFVETMTIIARSKNIFIRRLAFQALRGFKSRASFPLLVDALADRDDSIRYGAMFTLCMAMNAPDLPCPDFPLFQSDEQRYIRRVRAWWNTQQ